MHCGVEHRLCFSDNVHCFFDFTLRCFVALCLWFNDRHCRMVDIQNAMIVFGALKAKCSGNALLFAELEQEASARGGLCKSGIFDLTTESGKMFHNVVHFPLRQYVEHNKRAPDLLDFTRIIVGWQLRIGRQIVGLQFRITGSNILYEKTY